MWYGRPSHCFFLFILNILFARYYAAAATGWLFYLFTVNAFIIQLFGFSLESGIAYYTARKSIRESRLINLSLIWTLVVSLITLLIYSVYSSIYPSRVEYPIMYPVAFVAGNMLIAFGNAIQPDVILNKFPLIQEIPDQRGKRS